MEGGYAHGEKLPAERQLASAFGASRTTIRTALDQLEVERLVTRRVGSGTFVNFRAQGDTQDIAELTSPLELIEVRLGVEPNMVRLAVLNATARDIERLSHAIARMENASGDTEGFTLWDEEFHQLIAEATRNPLMVWIYRQINTVRTHSQWNAMKDKVLTPARIAEYNAQHPRCSRPSAPATWMQRWPSSPTTCTTRGANWSARIRSSTPPQLTASWFDRLP